MPDYYRLNTADALKELSVDAETGLSDAEVNQRREQHGTNELPKEGGASFLKLLISQFTDLMVIILIIAAAISFWLGEVRDFWVIMAIVILNAAIGVYQEYRAEQAIASLSAMQVPRVRVRRSGQVREISAEDLVPGDILLLDEGDRVPADGRLLKSNNLRIEEAALTGESSAVGKDTEALAGEDIGIGDRDNMVFMGTSVNYGRGEAVVTATGLDTELGNIAEMLLNVEQTVTPLQRRLNTLGRILAVAALVVVGIVFFTGWLLRGIPVEEMFLTAVSLAVAAVPEGLPALVTISLSLGASKMVKRNALIRRLPAVETLGSVTVICSDKTGTLTRNEMTATNMALPHHANVDITGIGYTPDGEFFNAESEDKIDPREDLALGRVLKAFAISTNANLEETDEKEGYQIIGDTTEGALIVAAQKVGWTRDKLEQDLPRVAELPFSSERKAMTTVHEVIGEEAKQLFPNTRYISITKGAPDQLLSWATEEEYPDNTEALTDERRNKWHEQVDEMAASGLRVLGVAYRKLDNVPEQITPEIERDLDLLGLVGILDPARPEAEKAVATARKAGIRSIMITGDHALTAEAISGDLGILREGEKAVTGAQIQKMSDDELLQALQQTSTFARVAPEHKLRIVRVLQREDEIVAMTGDGVNDAPALKQADIGIAMGITGTDVSKGAAAMILTDDNFASIVAAIEEGRVVYDNIRKFLKYLLSSNVGEILVMFVALLIGLPIPLIAIQILWINLVTDGLPAIALGFEEGEPGVMDRQPRDPQESVFADGTGRHIVWVGILIAALTLGGFIWGHAHNGMQPFSQTLGLEAFNADDLAALVGEDTVPDDWTDLSTEERVVLLSEEAEATGLEEHGGDSLIDRAERLPRTIAFSVLALTQVFEVMAIHGGSRKSFFETWFSTNPLLGWACLITFSLQLAVIYVPFLHGLLDTVFLSGVEFAVVLGLAAVVLFAVELEKLVFHRNS